MNQSVFHGTIIYLDVPLEVRINGKGKDQWVITPIYPVFSRL